MKSFVFVLAGLLAVSATYASDCKALESQVIKSTIRQAQIADGMSRAKLSREQLMEILPKSLDQLGDCDFATGIGCVAGVTGAVLACLAEIPSGIGLAACVAGLVGAGSSCYDCVCWVIEYLGFGC